MAASRYKAGTAIRASDLVRASSQPFEETLDFQSPVFRSDSASTRAYVGRPRQPALESVRSVMVGVRVQVTPRGVRCRSTLRRGSFIECVDRFLQRCGSSRPDVLHSGFREPPLKSLVVVGIRVFLNGHVVGADDCGDLWRDVRIRVVQENPLTSRHPRRRDVTTTVSQQRGVHERLFEQTLKFFLAGAQSNLVSRDGQLGRERLEQLAIPVEHDPTLGRALNGLGRPIGRFEESRR